MTPRRLSAGILEVVRMEEKLYRLLYALGLSANYRGFYCILSAVKIAACDPGALTEITKQIYQPIARQRGISWKSVERNIRTCVDRIWSTNLLKLQQLTGWSAPYKPTSAQFIATLAHCLGR